ncbi:MAG: protein tyrosine phosphatase [Marinovum sp.]|nr:protein tyrosine phosphatase [Marinovum sp.]
MVKILNGLVRAEKRLRATYNVAPDSPENRRKAQIYMLWFDHEVLRKRWTNLHQIAPGVFRSNQPTFERLKTLKKQGIDDIVNLRGKSEAAHYLVEEDRCRSLGLRIHSIELNARSVPEMRHFKELIELFGKLKGSFMMHCKSGSDRAGLASVIYLLTQKGETIYTAKRMLSFRFLHLKLTKTGVLDYLLREYERAFVLSGVRFENWLETDYDPDAINKKWASMSLFQRWQALR